MPEHQSSGATKRAPATAQPLAGLGILRHGFVAELARKHRYGLRPAAARDAKSLRRSGSILWNYALEQPALFALDDGRFALVDRFAERLVIADALVFLLRVDDDAFRFGLAPEQNLVGNALGFLG